MKRGRAASPPSSSRPARRGSRSPAGASPSTPSSPTSSPARRSSSSSRGTSAAASSCSWRARARSSIPRTPASRSGSCTAARRTRSCSATSPGRPRWRATRVIRSCRCSELVELHERIALPARPRAGRGVALNTRELDEDEARDAIAAAEAETGLVADDPVRFGPIAAAGRRARRARVALQRAGRAADNPAGQRHHRQKEDDLEEDHCGARSGVRAHADRLGDRRRLRRERRPGKYAEDGGAAFFGQMASAGLRQNVMTVRFLPSAPLTIPDKPFLDVAVPTAAAAGIAPVFAVYPYPPSEIEAGAASPAAFAAWLEALARTYPQVRTYIVGNEPNLNSFWRPQGDGAGRILSAARLRPVPGRRLRRAQGRLERHHRARPRPLAARRRRAERGRQVLSRALPRRARRLVPRERPKRAADGRPQLSPVSEPERLHRPVHVRLRLAERERAGARPDQAGRLGRLRRHRAADDAATACSLYLDEVGWQVDTVWSGRLRRAPRTSPSPPRPLRRRSTPSSSGTSSAIPTSPR